MLQGKNAQACRKARIGNWAGGGFGEKICQLDDDQQNAKENGQFVATIGDCKMVSTNLEKKIQKKDSNEKLHYGGV